MKLYITKAILDTIVTCMETHLEAGHWPKVKFSRSGGSRSYSMFDYHDVAALYKRAAHEWLTEHVDPRLGLWTRKRGEAMLAQLKAMLSAAPKTSQDVKIGSVVRLTAVPDISNEMRELTVDMCHNPDLPMIMEGDCKEENGYYGEHGSFYHYELRMLKVDGVWYPLDLTEEETAMIEVVRDMVTPVAPV